MIDEAAKAAPKRRKRPHPMAADAPYIDGPLPPLLTMREMELLLRSRHEKVRHYCRRGLLPTPRRLGQTLLWKKDEVLAAIERLPEGFKPPTYFGPVAKAD